MTPFHMMYGQEARRPVEVAENDEDLRELQIKLPTEETIIKSMSSIETNREKDASRAIKNVEMAQEKDKNYELDTEATEQQESKDNIAVGEKEQVCDTRKREKEEKMQQSEITIQNKEDMKTEEIILESSVHDEEEIVDKKKSSNEDLPTEQDMTKTNTRKRQPLITSKKHGKRRRMKMLGEIEKMTKIGKSCSDDEDIATDVEE
eukprot:gene19780-21718_t